MSDVLTHYPVPLTGMASGELFDREDGMMVIEQMERETTEMREIIEQDMGLLTLRAMYVLGVFSGLLSAGVAWVIVKLF